MSFLGSIAYKYFFEPIGQPLTRLKEDGGPYGRYQIKKGEAEMKQAASQLEFSCASKEETGYPWIHFLTGKRYWYQTIFCIHSLINKVDMPLHIVLHDDGSFDQEFVNQVIRQVKNCSVDFLSESTKRLDELLSKKDFPYLRSARDKFPLFYKLMDCRIGYSGCHVLLDSDMLFYHYPFDLVEWLKNPTSSLYMQDKYCSYTYSFELLEKIIGAPIRGYVNSGVTGMNNNLIDWKEIEEWAKQLTESEGVNYFFEQTLYAIYFTVHGGMNLDGENYKVIPTRADVLNAKQPLHHYPSGFRKWYFRYGWRNVLK